MRLQMTVLPGTFDIHRLPPGAEIPPGVWQGDLCAVLRSDEELSIVCRPGAAVPSEHVQTGWCCLVAGGPLDFTMKGVIAQLSGLLADAGISVFVVSSYDTDYLLVPSVDLAQTVRALTEGGIDVGDRASG